MKHFRFFPKIQYDGKDVIDIFRRAKIQDRIKNILAEYDDVMLRDDLRPDSLSFNLYGDALMEWVLFYANDIQDPIHDWPLSTNDFNAYIQQKYNTEDPQRIYTDRGKLKQVYITNGGDQRIVRFGVTRFTKPRIQEIVKHPLRNQYRRIISVLDQNTVFVDEPFSNPFPRSTSELESAYLYSDTHSYYETRTGLRIDYETWLGLPEDERQRKTYYEYEFELNEAKRRIQVIGKQQARQLYNELVTIFRE